MDKITKPTKREKYKYVFTEKIDYSKTGRESIWGAGDKDTLNLLKKIKIRGRWLNLAAGDGRYNLNLLKKVDFVVASDIDKGALTKLRHNTPRKYKEKLDTKVLDITKRFPFANKLYDGIFCTGILHLFSKEVLRKITLEMDRILRSKGKVLIDFVADAERKTLDGKLITSGDRPTYTLAEAKGILKNIFEDYKVKIYVSELVDDLQKTEPPYTLSCKFITLVANRK